MLNETMAKKEVGRITSAWHGREDHGCLTCMIGIDFLSGGHQAFGCVALDASTSPVFLKELLETFGAQDLNQLPGRTCVAYWKYGHYNEYIEALGDPVTGLVLQINEWRQRMHPGTPSLDEQELTRLRTEAASANRRAQEASDRIEAIRSGLVR